MKDGYAGLSWGFPRRSYIFWAVLRLYGVLLGLSLGSLGLSWPLLGLSLALPGLSRCSLGLSWSLLDGSGGSLGGVLSSGAFWTSLSGPLEPRGGKTARKWSQRVQRAAQQAPKGVKTESQKVVFSWLFRGQFLDPFRDSPSDGFLDAWSLQN